MDIETISTTAKISEQMLSTLIIHYKDLQILYGILF